MPRRDFASGSGSAFTASCHLRTTSPRSFRARNEYRARRPTFANFGTGRSTYAPPARRIFAALSTSRASPYSVSGAKSPSITKSYSSVVLAA
jgi:hypothetical protein